MDARTFVPARQDALPRLWRDPFFWLALVFSLFAVAPFLLPGYFWGANDARHHVYFLFEYDRVVQDGVWWPRWSPDFAFGYGYPFFNIYGLFSHFLAEVLLHFFGFSTTGAVEAVFALSIFGSAGAMYAFARTWVGRQGGLIAALVYVYAPYHLLNLYVRANLAESMAFVWLPLCLWASREVILRPGYRWVVLLAVSYGGLMLTSNLVIVLFSPLLGIYLLVLAVIYDRDMVTTAPPRITGTPHLASQPWYRWIWQTIVRLIPAGLGLMAGLGLSAIFWLPMAIERQYVRLDQWFDGRYDYRGNFVFLYQLFSPQWGYGISQPGPDDPIGFQIGAAALVLAVLGVLLTWRRIGRQRGEIACFVAAALGATLVATTWGRALWEVPLLGTFLGFAQFPWRWFGITTLCVSLLAGLIVHPQIRELDNNLRTGNALSLPLLALISVVILSSYPLLQVEITDPVEGPVSLAGLMRFQRSSDEMTGSTAWVKEIPTWSPMAGYYLDQDEAGQAVMPVETKLDYGPFDYKTFAADSIAHNTLMEQIYFFNATGHEQRVIFNHFYYPGWTAYLLDGRDGQPVTEVPIIPEEEGTLGRMTVPVPEGDGYLLLRFEDTPVRVMGKRITWTTILLLAVAGVIIGLLHRRAQSHRP